MNILHISTIDKGGAAVAVIRLHKALRAEGVDSMVLSKVKFKENIPYSYAIENFSLSQKIKLKLGLKKYVIDEDLKKLKGRLNPEWDFSFPRSEYDITKSRHYQQADIIQLHWTSYFFDWTSFFRINTKPLIWTLHDMNAFTGGCHYSRSCDKYTDNCPACPALAGAVDEEAAFENFLIKHKALLSKKGKIKVVTPSFWLKDASQKSTLFKNVEHEHIPYGLDTEIFFPKPKIEAKKQFNLPLNKKILLFVSESVASERKGFDLLAGALDTLRHRDDYHLCAVGERPENRESVIEGISYTGSISEEKEMSMLYSAADLFVIPSREDNFPNTVIESLCCGTPVLSFNRGGMADAVVHGENGIIVPELNEASLREKITEFLDGKYSFSRDKIRKNGVTKYDEKVAAQAYLRLYREFLNV